MYLSSSSLSSKNKGEIAMGVSREKRKKKESKFLPEMAGVNELTIFSVFHILDRRQDWPRSVHEE